MYNLAQILEIYKQAYEHITEYMYDLSCELCGQSTVIQAQCCYYSWVCSMFQAYGGDDLAGSFILDFHPQRVKCSFVLATNSFALSPVDGCGLELPPHVISKQYASREGYCLNVQLMFEDP